MCVQMNLQRSEALSILPYDSTVSLDFLKYVSVCEHGHSRAGAHIGQRLCRDKAWSWSCRQL